MAEHPTLLWHPTAHGLHSFREVSLPREPADYHVIELNSLKIVIVVAVANGEVVYKGPGPAKVYRSPTPSAN
jgi:hypothetical protein